MIKIAIVEDELKSRKLLRRIISDSFPEVKIIGEAKSGEDSLKMFASSFPDIVLMDIQLSDMTAIEVLNELEIIDFKVIFITAHNQYAVESYKFQAIDYVMKPFDIDKIESAIQRAIETIKLERKVHVAALTEKLPISHNEKISLGTNESIHIVKVQEIVYMEAYSSYTKGVYVEWRNDYG